MDDSSSFQGSPNDDGTEVLSQDENAVFTGLTCSPKAEVLSQEVDVNTGQTSHNISATEVLSQDENVVYTGQTCTPHVQTDTRQEKTPQSSTSNGSFDPDETYISVSKLRSGLAEIKPNIYDEGDHKGSSSNNRDELEKSNVSSTYSQELTQPVIQSQGIDDTSSSSRTADQEQSQDVDETPPSSKTAPQDTSSNKSINDTFEIMPSQDIQNSLSPTGFEELQGRLSRASTLEVKPSENVGERLDSELKTVISSSSSSSLPMSSSSSSKRTTESDDTDDNLVIGSQDMFVSQECSSTQPNIISVSQLMPTLQLSGDYPSSQSYETFIPGRLRSDSPTAGITSTPLRQFPKPLKDNKEDIISLSDEEEVQKLSEKRKLSDSSDEAKPDLKRAKSSFHSRPSVMVVEEVSIFKHPSTEDLTLGSQGYTLHLSQTDSSLGNNSQEITSPLTQNGSTCQAEQRTTTTAQLNLDDSVVNVEDVEDEVQFISPQAKRRIAAAEITLDSSDHAEEIEVLPLGNLNQNTLSAKSPENHNSSNNMHTSIGDVDHSKENVEPNKQNNQDFETEMVLTFTCTYKVTCKASVDAVKKNTTSRAISSFEILESNTVHKRDSSPSAVEESSPGRGGSSPGSVMSGPGLYPLAPTHLSRYSLISTTSSSSAGSAASLYRQVPAHRGRHPPGILHSTPHVAPNPLAPWKELLSHCQDELASSGSSHLENWEASRMLNSSSEDSKTTGEEKVLGTVVEDDEDVLGIPAQSIYEKAKLLMKKRPGSANSSTTASTVDSVQNLPVTNETAETECATPTTKRKRGRPAKAATPRTPSGSLKKKAQTPRKKKSNAPDAEEQSAPPEDSSVGSDYYSPGIQVFALWMDSFYYHGRLGASTRPNQWNVTFHDGEKRDLSKSEIHPINTFVIGQSAQAVNKKGDYRAGNIVDVIPGTSGKDDVYKFKFDESGSIVTVALSDLRLSEEQMQQFICDPTDSTNYTSNSTSSPSKRTSASKLGSIDLDNILPGKRVRTPKASQAMVNSPGRPGPSNTARRLIADGCNSSTAEDEPLANTLSTIPNIQGVQAEQVGFEKTADPLARKGKGVKKSASKKPLPDIDDEKIVQELGPMPPEGSRIFMGYTFLLTITDVCVGHRHEPVTDSERNNTDVEEHHDDDSSQCASDYECYQFAKARMVKDRLMRQILQGGGKVLKHWTEIVPREINNTYVVSNRPCNTAIYLQCLVRGVKGINHECIIHCCRENKRVVNSLKSYLLPAGYSLKRKEWILWSDHKNKQPLRSEHVLVEGDKGFTEFWEDILRLSGAKVATIKSIQGDFKCLTKVLSAHNCSEKTLKAAQLADTPVVSPLWIIQSLVENKPVLHNGLQCFAYDQADCD